MTIIIILEESKPSTKRVHFVFFIYSCNPKSELKKHNADKDMIKKYLHLNYTYYFSNIIHYIGIYRQLNFGNKICSKI